MQHIYSHGDASLAVPFLITFHLHVAFCLFFSLEPVEESLLEKYGFPEAGTETRCYTNHALSYDQAKRVPRWVIEHISKQKMLGMWVFISFHLCCLE